MPSLKQWRHFVFPKGVDVFLNSYKQGISNIVAKVNRNIADTFNTNLISMRTSLVIQHLRDGKKIREDRVLDKKITNIFCDTIVKSLCGLSEYDNFKNFKYHQSGVGTNPENSNDIDLRIPVGSRIIGTQEIGDTSNIYQSIAVITYFDNYSIAEHGLFNAQTGGILMDRTVFAPYAVIANDSLRFIFTIGFTVGGGS